MDKFNEDRFINDISHIPQILSMMQNAIKNNEVDQNEKLNQYMTWLETYLLSMQESMGYTDGELKTRLEKYKIEKRQFIKTIHELNEALGKEFTPEKVFNGFSSIAKDIEKQITHFGIITITLSKYGSIDIEINFSINRPSSYDKRYYKEESEFIEKMKTENAGVDAIIEKFEHISDNDSCFDILYNDLNKAKLENHLCELFPKACSFKYEIQNFRTTVLDKMTFSLQNDSLLSMSMGSL